MKRKTEPQFKTMIILGRLILVMTFIFILFIISFSSMACDEDDLTEISWRDYKPCMSAGDSVNWCKRK